MPPRASPPRPHRLAALALLLAACGSGGKGTPPSFGERCDIDLAPYRALPSGAVARRISDPADLLQGDAAQGRLGDYLLANDRIRVVVQGPDRHVGPNPYGGAIVDADVVRPAGERSSDQLGEIAPFYNFGRTTRVERVEVLPGPGAAVLAATGEDELNDYLNVKTLLGGSFLKVDPDARLDLLTTTYYLLAQGESRVRIVTAFCNRGGDALLAVGDLVDPGGAVELFNPRSPTAGFGSAEGLGSRSDFPFYAFWGARTAYAYVPPAPAGNAQLTISGVVGTLLGSSLEAWFALLPGEPAGALRVPRGGRASYERALHVGRDLGEVTSAVHASQGPTVAVSGRVTLGGQPVEAARVAVVKTEWSALVAPRRHAVAVLPTGPDGRYAGRVPRPTCNPLAPAQCDAYELAADAGGVARSPFQPVDASADVALDLALPAPATVRIALHDPAGRPVPGKVLVHCDSGCVPRGAAGAEGNFFRSAAADPWPDGVQAVAFVDTTGAADLDLPSGGAYTFVASRGPAWSASVRDALGEREAADGRRPEGGAPLVVVDDPALRVDATVDLELAPVVDAAGWISGDFHVHGVSSPDSAVSLADRVRTFLGEGVDLLVATDHDVVTDYGPTLAALDLDAGVAGAPTRPGDWLATLAGEEVTTFDYGHWNGFPLARDPADLAGGALDWAGGPGSSLSPAAIHSGLRRRGAGPDTVVQANHPRGELGWFTAIRLDSASGVSHACPQAFRIAPVGGCDVAAGSLSDTGLFDETFTAMEVVNDREEQRIHGRLNDWFTFLSRGLAVTATAVSDTHHAVLTSAGWGRTWVRLGSSDPRALDPQALARAVNEGRAVASLGAFVTVEATNGVPGTAAGVGDTIAGGPSGPVRLRVVVQTPEWIVPARIELHGYRPSRVTRHEATGTDEDGFGNRTWPGYGAWPGPCGPTVDCNRPKAAGAEAADLLAAGVQVFAPAGLLPETVATGSRDHRRHRVEHTFEVDPPADAWYVVVVRREASRALDPLAPGVAAGPPLTLLAVTNPVLVDVDGGGWQPPAPVVERSAPWSPPPAAELPPEERLRRADARLHRH